MNKKYLLVIIMTMSILGHEVYASPYVDVGLGGNTTSNSMAYMADGGYKFNEYLGLEGGVTSSGSSNVTKGNFYMFDGAGKLTLPLGSQVSAFGKLGVGDCSSCGSNANSNLGVFFGGGLQFDLNRNWALQLQDYTVTGDAPNFIMFGGEFKFN
jgi:opacity protein-like surface antigen